MKLLVTGGAGFIGSHLVEELLNNKNEVIIIDNFNETYSPTQKRNNIKKIKDKVKVYDINLNNKADIEKVFKKEKNFDYIFHLAGIGGVRPSQDNPILYYEENVIATIKLVEAMKKYNCNNLIYYSSSSVYGNINKKKFSEKDISDTPISVYAATKRAAEILLYNYYLNYNFNIIVIRPFTVYGPRQRPDLAIHKFTKNILNNKAITVYGDGSMLRDYTYVKDTINATIKAMEYMKDKKELYETFNVASSNPKTIKEMINIIEEITNKKAKIKYEDKPIGDVNKTYGDINKAKKLLNWEPQTNFKDGIKEFVTWYIENEK